eukprot:233582_1
MMFKGIPLIILCGTLIFSFTLYSGNWFCYHTIFMVLAYLGFMSNALFLGGNHWFHFPFQILCVLCADFAWYVIWTNKGMQNKNHNTTWHAWIGVVCMVINNAQCVIAALGLGPQKAKEDRQPMDIKKHRIGGTVLFTLTMINCHIGYVTHVNFNPAKFLPFDLFLGFVTVTCLYKVWFAPSEQKKNID